MGKAALEAIAEYYYDVMASLTLYVSEECPDFLARLDKEVPEFLARFLGEPTDKLRAELMKRLEERLEETELRSAFVILTIVEAAFRLDYKYRCEKKLKDDLSRDFRAIYKDRKTAVRLDEDIFEAWKQNQPDSRKLIDDLREAFGFRHWLAHGRYWKPKLGRKYDFDSVYDLADIVFGNLSLHEID
jgi:hypothetical protein